MFSVLVNLTSDEWVKIQQAPRKAFPNEALSRAEIVRRYTLAGMEALASVSPADRSRMAHRFQASTEAGEERMRD